MNPNWPLSMGGGAKYGGVRAQICGRDLLCLGHKIRRDGRKGENGDFVIYPHFKRNFAQQTAKKKEKGIHNRP